MIGTVAAAALFGGLVHAVLVAAHVSEPAATTVYGMTLRRFWATTVVVLALVGVGIGGLAWPAQPIVWEPLPGDSNPSSLLWRGSSPWSTVGWFWHSPPVVPAPATE